MIETITKEHYEKFIYPDPKIYIAPAGNIGLNVHMERVESDALVVGCGTVQALLVARDSPNNHIVGIDTSHASIEWAREQAKKEKIANVELIEASVTNFKYIRPFKTIIASCVLHHILEIDDALTNIKRNLMDPDEKSVLHGRVYRKKGRGHILQTRRMLQALGIKTVEGVRNYITNLSEYHPSRLWYEKYVKNDSEIADTWLNPYAVHYDQPKWINVLGRNGFKWMKWENSLLPDQSTMGWTAW
jgi:SAM-dependent methyltransferase